MPNVSYDSVIKSIARKTGNDTTKAGKRMRSTIRSNFDTLAHDANWKQLAAMRKQNRDGNRYPREMPEHVAAFLVSGDKGKLRDTSRKRTPRKRNAQKAAPVTAPEQSGTPSS